MVEKGWRDSEQLRRMYWEDDMTMEEIADELGCTAPTIHDWMGRFDIETRKATYQRPPSFGSWEDGYETWTHGHDGRKYHVRVHRLLAVAEFGFDAVGDKVIHHKNNIPWDNRPANIKPMDITEHSELHNPSKESAVEHD